MALLNRRRVIGLILLVAILLLIELTPLAQRPLAPFLRFSSRLEGGLFNFARVSRFYIEKTIIGQEASSRLSELESRLSELSLDRSYLALLQEENNNLRRLVNFQESHSRITVTTRVIGEDPKAPAQFRLAAGRRAGIKAGAAVISPEGALVGVISDVGEEISIMRLLEHRLTQVSVRILGKKQAFGFLESVGGLSLRMTQIPKDADIKPNDVVVTSFVSESVPPDLLVGTVLEGKNDPQGLWQEATIAPLVEPDTLNIVTVITAL
ncbi:hypothetical protein A3H10_02625 [Candidatus Uhrbacteria bacterium RIFCSPLOWO2_12_FULL_46_10]|uniref:Cell shape-determining protein MreC n=1 Tax=Candidatus Uhrbacteria bacterium RIFCSPLOWO2_01_FULL_47_25 TaxID=1802402 RepID=A0A1F7UWN1_9BACT|nr:MAG: hypothetical protein A2752_02385 [Candidatus Uhrbacteria bacterium RIFCSPHIGHO2_01_FULL_46_23]OGL68707.1 MAG: hypothetical protein A3D60_01990 [Candidatus Uhrbacteria bacterium RIFCSPHIGHO2_02_FULL_47_29]OGL74733.1 MAG: hypothetical protein A3E96_03270 [Candidatus Uhrbacteria bacterium RIFCSPHIGHO2_12_FULL_46_13]OGL82144.1 MAG: hypothetical protein A2936_01105 [Candidatus Uhrbacteria bacterium RIFCSPLOWO2_01_FULL_47_25]OGL85653.1 MAG: hypothetical protein A3I37_04230 [Candidatus Uhrbact